MYPIKYIDNNLVWNKDNEVFAYYELIPYNYSFLSAEQKFIVHDSFRQLIAQSREGKIHALQIATESSIRSIQEQSKKLVTGRLKDVAFEKIDEQTEALVSMIGDNQVDYRFCFHDWGQSGGLPLLSRLQAHGNGRTAEFTEREEIRIYDVQGVLA